ncbi:hypothetical protein BDV98DRAFT_583096 [Pterulicium gracile]|uniref:Uncharacterized protein n=1 Tax=Pterulicium gracile TaxID=1884261 RepID=A0A5C3QHS6_9AGAR|nr:hypothetical protein BDV98DRAFT_583096 [Pterula gracilis]
MSFTNGTDTSPTGSTPVWTADDVQILTRLGLHLKYTVTFTMAELPFYVRTFGLSAALAVTFIFTTVIWSLDVAAVYGLINTVLLGNADMDVLSRVMSYNTWIESVRLEIVSLWMGNSTDTGAIALWRSGGRRVLSCVLLFLITTAFTLWLSYVGLVMRLSNTNSTETMDNNDAPAILATTASAASIAANLLATAMIGFVAMMHKNTRSRGIRSHGAKILFLLTESGAFCVVLQIVRLSLALSINPSTQPYGRLWAANSIFHSVTQTIVAMYTPALILIIHYGFSVADTVHLGTDLDSGSSRERAQRRREREGTISQMRFGNRSAGDGTQDSLAGDIAAENK